jgi:acyl carrier protein
LCQNKFNILRLSVEDRIKDVMAAVFEMSIDEITDISSPDNIESWDSLKHMSLVVALEEEFCIQFTDEEILEIINYPLIKSIILEKLI